VMYWLFHTLFKYPAFSLLPCSHQERIWSVMCRAPERSFRHWLLVVAALGIGTLTHIVWDSCTHWYGWTVQHFAWLQWPLLHTSSGTLRIYKVLQHGGTLVGSGILLWWYFVWLHNTSPVTIPVRYSISAPVKRLLLISLCGGAGVCGVVLGYILTAPVHNLASFSTFVVLASKIGMGALLAGSLLVSIGWHVGQQQQKHAQETVTS
jgi:hypothetical protein